MKKVCVIGNLNVDIIVGRFTELPQWGREKITDCLEVTVAGQVGYTAKALANLGFDVNIIANVGDDYYGHFILQELGKINVNVEGINVLQNIPTGVTIAIINQQGERAFISYLGSMKHFGEKDIKKNWDLIRKSDYVVFNGYFLLPSFNFDVAKALFSKVQKMGKRIVFDTGWDPDDWPPEHINQVKELLSYVDVFLPNLDEARVLTHKTNLNNMLEALNKWGPSVVAVKMGEKGSVAMRNGKIFQQNSFKVKVNHTTGAGDTFNAGFIYGLMNKWSLNETLKFANAFASLYISGENALYPKIKEIWQFIREYGK